MAKLISKLAFTTFLLVRFMVGDGATPQVPAMFVFGDSLVDNGNNNYMSSWAKANYYPYGIDFFQGPTGRFCNGKTIIDFVCEMLGIPYLPAHATTNLGGARLVGGVNYASAAGGILDESGQYLGERTSMSQQVLNFGADLNDLRVVVGGQHNLNQHIAKSIMMVVIGSNDYLNNYLQPILYPSGRTYSPEGFGDLLIDNLNRELLALHSLGARKFFLAGVGPLGCIPNQRATGSAPSDRCVDRVNEIVGYFNRGLRTLVEQLNNNYPGSIFVYGNTYGALGDMLNNPSPYGFRVIDKGCCGVGRNQGEITCLPLMTPCDNRREYMFWDAFHPTEAVNAILARRAFFGPPSDCYPMNMQQMTQV